MPRRTLVERVAMELRQIEAEGASHHPYGLTAEQTWAPASEVLREGYRRDARRLLRLVHSWLRRHPPEQLAEEASTDLMAPLRASLDQAARRRRADDEEEASTDG